MFSKTEPLIQRVAISAKESFFAGEVSIVPRTLTTTPETLFDQKRILSLHCPEARLLLHKKLRNAEYLAASTRIHNPTAPASAIITKIFVPPLIGAGYEAKRTDILPDDTPYLCTEEGEFPVLCEPQLDGKFEALLAARMLFVDSFPYGKAVDHGTFFHILQNWFLQHAYENGLMEHPPLESYQNFSEYPAKWITCRDNNDEHALESPRTGMLLEYRLPPPPGVIDEAWEKASPVTIAGLMSFQATYPTLTKELVQARKEVQSLANGKKINTKEANETADCHAQSFTVKYTRRENDFSRGF
jgi:hypothetical protein